MARKSWRALGSPIEYRVFAATPTRSELNRPRTIPLGILGNCSLYLDILVTQSMTANNHRRRPVSTSNQFPADSASLLVCAPQFVATKSSESFVLRPKRRQPQYRATGPMGARTAPWKLVRQRAPLPRSRSAEAVAALLQAANHLA